MISNQLVANDWLVYSQLGSNNLLVTHVQCHYDEIN